MTPTETATILRQFNEWRRGDYAPEEQPTQPDPVEISEAIDAAVEMIERMERQEPVALVKWQVGGQVVHIVGNVKPGDILYALPGAQPAPSFADAYQGAMEEAAIWKKRALEAEELNRKFAAEINGPTYMGEPVQNVPSVPDGWQLVPMEPTIHMCIQGDNSRANIDDCTRTPAIYRAMLAAAPEAKP